ncbi:MAG TPA: NusG domain II-containing protein [Selenomonadales bacterium]|nr:NusG domain II-containing protein [Selenomonadales bacterium]
MVKSSLTAGDKTLIAFLLLGSLGFLVYQWSFWPQQAVRSAEVRVNGRLVQTLPLRIGYTQELRIGGQTEYAIIEIKDDKIRIRQDDSPRQIGVQTGWISQPPQTIVNLPYRIVVTVVSAAPSEIDAIAH